jgi:hypothetical protein
VFTRAEVIPETVICSSWNKIPQATVAESYTSNEAQI